MSERLPALVALVCALAWAAPAAAEEPATVHRWLVNVTSTMPAELTRLEAAMGDLAQTAQRLVASGGDADSILALARDSERIARSADVLSRKAERLVELADALPAAPAE